MVQPASKMASTSARTLDQQQLWTLQHQVQEVLLIDHSEASRTQANEWARWLLQAAHHPDALPLADDGALDSQQSALQPSRASQLALQSLLAPREMALVPAQAATSVQGSLQRAYEETRHLRLRPSALLPSSDTQRGWLAPPRTFDSRSSLEWDAEAQSRVNGVRAQLDGLHESLRKFRFARIHQAADFRQLLPEANVQPLALDSAHQRQPPPPLAFAPALLPAQPPRASISVVHSPRTSASNISQPPYPLPPFPSQPDRSVRAAAQLSDPWQQPQAATSSHTTAADPFTSSLEQQLLHWQWQQDHQQSRSVDQSRPLPVAGASSSSAFGLHHAGSRSGTPPLHTPPDSGMPYTRSLEASFPSSVPAEDWRSLLAPSSTFQQQVAAAPAPAPSSASSHVAHPQRVNMHDLLQASSHSYSRTSYQ